MALEDATYLDDLDAENPEVNDPKSQGDDHIRMIKEVLQSSFPSWAGPVLLGGIDTGVADTYVLAAELPEYVANTIVVWKPINTNTGASTVNINALGTRDIKAINGDALDAGELTANQYTAMVDNGTEYRLLSISKAYVDALAFNTVLPDQFDNGGKFLGTDGTTAAWGNSLDSLTLANALPVESGGTGVTTLAALLTAMGAASSGANTNITSLSGLTTPLSLVQGGTAASSAAAARTSLGAAKSGSNSDITALTALSTPLSVAQGGTGGSTAATARTSLGAAATVNPIFTGNMTLPANNVSQIKEGTGDGASTTLYNLAIRSWWGIGFRDNTDSETVAAFINTRTGEYYGLNTAKAWGKFSSAGTLAASHNITSVVKNFTGSWTVTIATDLADANYHVSAMGHHNAGVSCTVISVAAGSFNLKCWDTANTLTDPTDGVSFSVFGN